MNQSAQSIQLKNSGDLLKNAEQKNKIYECANGERCE
jgi:hypothetical protein